MEIWGRDEGRWEVGTLLSWAVGERRISLSIGEAGAARFASVVSVIIGCTSLVMNVLLNRSALSLARFAVSTPAELEDMLASTAHLEEDGDGPLSAISMAQQPVSWQNEVLALNALIQAIDDQLQKYPSPKISPRSVNSKYMASLIRGEIEVTTLSLAKLKS